MNDVPALSFQAHCPICQTLVNFSAPDDYYSCRSQLRSSECPLGNCVSRDRALAKVVFSVFDREQLKTLSVHEAGPTSRGLTLWLRNNCVNYVQSGYFPDQPAGAMVAKLRNEDLEAQTFPENSFALVLHLDVLEHLFDPFQALREIYRTLIPGGYCIMTAPTYAERVRSEQVSFKSGDGTVRIIGTPEYHGNPQHPDDGALVTWRYGYDLALQIDRETGFGVEVRRWQSMENAIMGPMTEVYLLKKPG